RGTGYPGFRSYAGLGTSFLLCCDCRGYNEWGLENRKNNGNEDYQSNATGRCCCGNGGCSYTRYHGTFRDSGIYYAYDYGFYYRRWRSETGIRGTLGSHD